MESLEFPDLALFLTISSLFAVVLCALGAALVFGGR